MLYEGVLNNLVEEVTAVKDQINELDSVTNKIDSVIDRLDSVTRLLEYMVKKQERTNELLDLATDQLIGIEVNTR